MKLLKAKLRAVKGLIMRALKVWKGENIRQGDECDSCRDSGPVWETNQRILNNGGYCWNANSLINDCESERLAESADEEQIENENIGKDIDEFTKRYNKSSGQIKKTSWWEQSQEI